MPNDLLTIATIQGNVDLISTLLERGYDLQIEKSYDIYQEINGLLLKYEAIYPESKHIAPLKQKYKEIESLLKAALKKVPKQ
jgi:hypothetical protein